MPCTYDAIVVASRPSVLTLAGRAWAACPVPSEHDLTRRVVCSSPVAQNGNPRTATRPRQRSEQPIAMSNADRRGG
jgi:hypothetical protein